MTTPPVVGEREKLARMRALHAAKSAAAHGTISDGGVVAPTPEGERLFAEVQARYPKIMARLAESERQDALPQPKPEAE